MKLFADFNAVGVTMLIATHDVDLIRRMGRTEIKLDSGRLELS
jgi:cell division transport system ATP-binding protein